MTWTYGDPVSTPLYAVRFLIGDTISTDPQLQDEEIAYLLIADPKPEQAAVNAAQAIAARYSRLSDVGQDDLRVAASKKADHYFALSRQLANSAARTVTVPIPYAGGMSQADREADAANPDLPLPWAFLHMFDFIGTSPPEPPGRSQYSWPP